jgi:hypothetical protein
MTLRPLGDQYCCTCRWFENWESDPSETPVPRESMCRRYPPVTVITKALGVHARFPNVDSLDWCGDGRPRGRSISDIRNITVTHEEAIHALQCGCHVAREGWKIGTSLVLCGPYRFAMQMDRASVAMARPGTPSTVVTYYIDMEHPDGTVTYWTGTPADLVADNWMVVPPGDPDHPSLSPKTLWALQTAERTRNQTPKQIKKAARKKVKKNKEKNKEKNKKTLEAPDTQETMPF